MMFLKIFQKISRKKSKKKKKVIGVKVTLLKRSSKNERVFDPTTFNVENNCDDENNTDSKVKEEKKFSGDFISFSSKPIKRKKEVSSNINVENNCDDENNPDSKVKE